MAATGDKHVWEDGSRDRREHGGAPMRPDDEALARRTERERVDVGLDAYDPDDVPAATDTPPLGDVTDTEVYEEERAEVKRQLEEGELYPLTEEHPFPPTRYDRT
ncbi:MAG: hypothetical protein JO296_11930 [Pseudonocardiales bacterium]|jgi:hypothetical protein|nr:hypothetical protein [Pseudonocardiales bacterium]MBV9650834.1 hypothetical protein [Pseudonocardiales bacterium]